jgi:hypothetical protein
MDAPIPVPSAAGLWHFVAGFVVFTLMIVLVLALLTAGRDRGIDPVGKIAGLFAPTKES